VSTGTNFGIQRIIKYQNFVFQVSNITNIAQVIIAGHIANTKIEPCNAKIVSSGAALINIGNIHNVVKYTKNKIIYAAIFFMT
jgi:hypothetical protein